MQAMDVITPTTSTTLRQHALTYPWPASMPAPTREEIHDLIDGLIAYLDAMDGDADLKQEPDDEDGRDAEPEEQDTTAVEWTGRGAHRFNDGLAA